MMEIFTGLVDETVAQIAERLSRQIPMPVCASKVKEQLFADPPSFVRIENQQRTNMCAAHAGTSVIEVVGFQVTGEMVQRSRNYLYAKAQTYCGLYGDRGVTLGSIVKALETDGCPPEELYPFRGQFDSRIPPGADEAAKACRVTATVDVRSGGYQSVRTLIGQNMGTVLMASYWPIEYSSGYIVERYRPEGNGGHARALLSLASRLDANGRPYVWCANSHDVSAQFHGWELWSPTAVDELLDGDTWGATGITGLTVMQPQEVDWTGVLNPFAR